MSLLPRHYIVDACNNLKLAVFMGMHPDNWNAPMVLLGNKRDVIDEKPSERQVSKDDVKKTVKKWSNCKYAEITCKRATEGPGHYLFQTL